MITTQPEWAMNSISNLKIDQSKKYEYESGTKLFFSIMCIFKVPFAVVVPALEIAY